MSLLKSFINICFLILLLFACNLQAADKSDTRVLIDISGSMKQNDPQNLRGAALRLMVALMPKGNRVGVWTFGQYTNELIPLGEVNASWKKRASVYSHKISSPGQLTNIEEVLQKASADWSAAGQGFDRNIILLTDGMVDISRNSSVNEASRQRILEKVVPAIKAAGGTIHTIALSDHADEKLMREVADATDGWFEKADSADQLQRVFLRLFEKVGKPDSVPLQGNSFRIDRSISEATLLIFSGEGGEPPKLKTPDGKTYSADDDVDDISWHRDQGYDLITLKKPVTGEWTIEAEMDPDNRVLVVTDLKMITTDMPNRVAIGESIPVEVYFTENDQAVSRQDFIEVLNVTVSQIVDGVASEAKPLADDGISPDEKPADGRFVTMFSDSAKAGSVEMVIHADGKTFVRERRQLTEVVNPARLEVNDDLASTQAGFEILLDEEVVQRDSLSIDAWVEDMSGQRMDIEFAGVAEGKPIATLDKNTLVGRQLVVINVKGKTLSGNEFFYQPEQVSIEGFAKEPAIESQPEAETPAQQIDNGPAEPAPEVKPESLATKSPAEPAATTPEVEEQAEPEEETNWVMMGLIIGGANLLLALLGGGVWWFMRKRSQEDDLEMLVSGDAPDIDEAPESSAPPQDEAEVSAATEEDVTEQDNKDKN